MPYLEEFKTRTANHDFPGFLKIWEEYSNSDQVEPEEFIEALDIICNSDLAASFGKYVETALPLWSSIEDPEGSYQILKRLIDLETTNSSLLSELATKALKERYGDQPQFEQRLRLVGLRGVGNYQGAITNFELLVHMAKGKFVFHTGGWGVGEIMEISLIREQLVIEFEHVLGKRDFSFENAFKQLQPVSDDHFLAKRFGNPDQFEEEAKKDPVGVVKKLLHDLGPKTAAEIKDALCEWVIPEDEWTKWWQNARARLKKDTMIEAPSTVKDPFILREEEVSHEDRLHKEIMHSSEVEEIILATYNFARDFPNMLKNEEICNSIEQKLRGLLENNSLTPSQELQILIFFDQFLNLKDLPLKERIEKINSVEQILDSIPIQALKKRLLDAVKKFRSDWSETFLSLFLTTSQNQIRDYLYGELKKDKEELKGQLEKLLQTPTLNPEAYVWYFQRLTANKGDYYTDKEGQCRWLESFLILLHKIESDPKWKDLTKKMIQLLTAKRFLITREILEGSSLDFAKEFLLLVSKCQSFTGHDLKILRSLVQVVHPSLDSGEEEQQVDHTLWTTKEGFLKMKDRIEQIGTVEIVENAREIEEARALGDLKENSEYKFAQERRHRLQSELRMLSEQIGHARILTSADVETDTVSIGTVVDLINGKGEKISYTILGPWDADPEKNILSFQSKLAEEMIGRKQGESFSFRGENYEVATIRSCIE